jgi:hypothetical protein
MLETALIVMLHKAAAQYKIMWLFWFGLGAASALLSAWLVDYCIGLF